MKGSSSVSYACHKKSLNYNWLIIDFPDWVKNKKATTNRTKLLW